MPCALPLDHNAPKLVSYLKLILSYLVLKFNKFFQVNEHREKMKSYYKTVPRQLLVRVYQAYKLDFQLFQYDFNDVLKLAGYQPLSSIESDR